MIVFDNVAKKVGQGALAKVVFRDLSVTPPTNRRLAILGLPGSGKTTLISLLAGIERPNSGTINRYARVSFPVGFGKSLKPSLSMRQNAKFAARIYGCSPSEVSEFVEKIMGFDPGVYDAVMKKLPALPRFAYTFALAYAIPFDTYLIDGSVAGPPGKYRANILALCEARAEKAGIIFATPHVRLARQICDTAAVITGKGLILYDDIEEAIEVFQESLDAHAMKQELDAVDGVEDESESV